MTFTRITPEELTTNNMLHYKYIDVNSLVKVINELNKEIYELKKINMERAKRELGNVKVDFRRV